MLYSVVGVVVFVCFSKPHASFLSTSLLFVLVSTCFHSVSGSVRVLVSLSVLCSVSVSSSLHSVSVSSRVYYAMSDLPSVLALSIPPSVSVSLSPPAVSVFFLIH